MNFWGGSALAVSFLANVFLLVRRPKCRHHWHPADAMIAWRCCWCDADRDGWPTNDTFYCAEKTVRLERERDQAVMRASELAEENQALIRRHAELAEMIARERGLL